MAEEAEKLGPRFEVGEPIRIVGFAKAHPGRNGVIIEVMPPGPDRVYRYTVQFADEGSATFFGFELQRGS